MKPQPSIGVGQPAMAMLNAWGQTLYEAFGTTAYLVGSAAYGKEWRDVDVRMLLTLEEYKQLIGSATKPSWSHPRFAALCISISLWGQKVTGLPIDFQFEEQDVANEREQGRIRVPLGIWFDGEHR